MKKVLAIILFSILLFGCTDLGGQPTPTPSAKPAATAKPTAKPTATAAVSATPAPSPTPSPLRLSISGLTAVVNGSNATVSWTTNNLSDSLVEYSLNDTASNAFNSSNVTKHSVNIAGLAYRSAYSFTATSCREGVCNSSSGVFTTPHRPCEQNMHYFEDGDFCMDSYEASRSVEGKPVSTGGRVAWAMVNYSGARLACASVGKRLCTSREFSVACNIDGERHGPIGDSECNINSRKPSKTGEASNCTSAEGVHDLIGNMREWVSDLTSINAPKSSGYVDTGEDALSLGASRKFPETTGLETEKYGDDYFLIERLTAPSFEGLGVTRGGDYYTGPRAGCFAYNVGLELTTIDPLIGFRCCS